MMALDMTAQLAPVVWGTFGLLLASAVGVIIAALPRTEHSDRPLRALRQASMPAAA
jgi:hypothetical protein